MKRFLISLLSVIAVGITATGCGNDIAPLCGTDGSNRDLPSFIESKTSESSESKDTDISSFIEREETQPLEYTSIIYNYDDSENPCEIISSDELNSITEKMRLEKSVEYLENSVYSLDDVMNDCDTFLIVRSSFLCNITDVSITDDEIRNEIGVYYSPCTEQNEKRLTIIPIRQKLSQAKEDYEIDFINHPRRKIDDDMICDKPVIYLYPEQETEVNVKLDFNGQFTCTYPTYNADTGWNVTAYPDGRLVNEQGREFSYLYWEGTADICYDLSAGFVVKGEDTADFLREKLEYMGLTPKEYNEFIVYWLPRMQNNKYNLITFQKEKYTDNAVLDITPQPDSILRVFMAYKPLDEYVEIPQQKLDTFDRKGFAVVEWGGTELKN